MAVQLFAAIDPTGTFLYACALDTVKLIPQPITGLGTPPTITVNAVGNTLLAAMGDFGSSKVLTVICWYLTTPLSGGETVLITTSANWLTTADGNLGAVTGATVTNATGLEYPAIGNLAAFNVTPTMPLGIIQTGGPAQAGFNYYPLMNWRTRLGNWTTTAGTITLASDCAPVTWSNPAATISSLVESSAVTNEVDLQGEPFQLGTWTVMYDDPNIGTAAELQTWLSSGNSIIGGTNSHATGLDTTSRITGVRTTSGLNTVIITYPNVGLSAGFTKRDLHLCVNHKQSSGTWTVSNYAIFPPQPAGTVLDRTPFKIDGNFKALNTSASGKTPLWYRTVSSGDTIGFGISNTVDNSDRTQPNWFSFHGPFQPGQTGFFTSDPNAVGGNPITSIRRFNTDVTLSNGPHGNSTYSWPAVTGFISSSMPWGSFQSDSSSPVTYQGFPLSTNMTPYSSADNGACLFEGTLGYYCFEITFANPHGLKTGQQVTFPAPGNNAPTLSFTASGGVATNIGTSNIAPFIWVSAPNAFVVQGFGTITTGSGIGVLTSTTPLLPGTHFTQFVITSATPANNHGSALAVEANASIASQLNANLWLNVGMWASPACCQAMASAVQQYYPTLSLMNVETGDEHWNAPAGQAQVNLNCSTIGKLVAYLPNNTAIGSYFHSTFGTSLNVTYAYMLVQNIQTEAFISVLGRAKVLPSFGAQWATAPMAITTRMMTFINTLTSPKMPCGSINYADYDLAFRDATIVNAFNSTANGGQNWSCTSINSWEALQCRLNSATWATIGNAYSLHQTYTGPTSIGGVSIPGQIGGKPAAICYEAAIQNYITPGLSGGLPLIPNQNALQQDCWYTSNYTKCLRSFLQMLQTGDPNTSASNGWWSSICFYGFMTSWFASSPNWQLANWPGQLAGTGVGNTNTSQSIQSGGVAVHQQFATAQGGSPGTGANYDMTNDSIALTEFLAWIDIANGAPAPPPPPPPPPVFPGRKIFTAVYNGFVFNGLPFDGGEGSFLPPVVLADPRQGAILPPNKDPAMVDPRQGFIIDTPTVTNQVDPRQGTIIG